MASSEVGSAVDDRVETVHFGPPPLPQDNLDYYNGPRDGHWSIDSSCASAIDDRCPTVWQLPTGHSPIKGPRHTKPINGELLKKLARATLLDKRGAEAETKARDKNVTDSEKARTSRDDVRAPEQKGFYVPRLPYNADRKKRETVGNQYISRYTRIESEVEDRPKQVQEHYSRQQQAPQTKAQTQPAEKQQALRKDQNIKPPKAQQIFPEPRRVQQPKARQSKAQPPRDELPKNQQYDRSSLPRSRSSSEKIPSSVSKNQTSITRHSSRHGAESCFENSHPARFSRPDLETIQHHDSKTTSESERARMARFAADAMMSGALPASAKATPQDVNPASFDWLKGNRPASVSVHSSISYGAHNSRPEVARNDSNGEIQNHRSFTPCGFQLLAPESAHTSAHRDSRSGTPEHPFWDSPVTEKTREAVKAASHKSRNTYRVGSACGGGITNTPATIFAGKGWISPHPLSEAPAPLASPPQSKILFPVNEYQKAHELTHAEYRAVQEGFVDLGHGAGTDSFVSDRPESVASNIIHVKPPKSSKSNYRRPTVQAEDTDETIKPGKKNIIPNGLTPGEMWLKTRESHMHCNSGAASGPPQPSGPHSAPTQLNSHYIVEGQRKPDRHPHQHHARVVQPLTKVKGPVSAPSALTSRLSDTKSSNHRTEQHVHKSASHQPPQFDGAGSALGKLGNLRSSEVKWEAPGQEGGIASSVLRTSQTDGASSMCSLPKILSPYQTFVKSFEQPEKLNSPPGLPSQGASISPSASCYKYPSSNEGYFTPPIRQGSHRSRVSHPSRSNPPDHQSSHGSGVRSELRSDGSVSATHQPHPLTPGELWLKSREDSSQGPSTAIHIPTDNEASPEHTQLNTLNRSDAGPGLPSEQHWSESAVPSSPPGRSNDAESSLWIAAENQADVDAEAYGEFLQRIIASEEVKEA